MGLGLSKAVPPSRVRDAQASSWMFKLLHPPAPSLLQSFRTGAMWDGQLGGVWGSTWVACRVVLPALWKA